MKKYLILFVPMLCFGMEEEREDLQDSRTRGSLAAPTIVSPQPEERGSIVPTSLRGPPVTYENRRPSIGDDIRFSERENFPMQILSESACTERCLRFSTTCCFLSRGFLNVLAGLFYTIAGGLLVAPGMLTDNASTIKLYNMFAVFAIVGAISCRELATCSQRHMIDNEREFARIRAYREQNTSPAPGTEALPSQEQV
ncbi:MAG: hypothetical protein LBD66_03005 [Holosporales bacterium]|jgi:hypothetical protein|nr:hypothetical protein [Holosporales bacterium]